MKPIKKILMFILVLATLPVLASFHDHFLEKTLRIDYIHAGNATSEYYFLDHVTIEPYWGGSLTNLVDTTGYGKYFFRMIDDSTSEELYSRGYCTLFSEWQTVEEAKTVARSFSETVVMPLPLKKARILFFSRNRQGRFEEVFRYDFEPSDKFISSERKADFPVLEVMVNGKPSKQVDIVLLPEGYTAADMESFRNDCRLFATQLLGFEPYKKYRDRFSIRAVEAPSAETGSDIPGDTVWKRTVLGSSFYTFDSERYCMIRDTRHLRDLASSAPYDQIYVLVNSSKYGGGAIYNDYSISVNSNAMSAKIYVHEFGHGFAGLGDEYGAGTTSYQEFYPKDVEPWEPNLTTLVDFSAKWQDLVNPETPVPTPPVEPWIGETGVFEGGGYESKGIYRPAHDCLMNTFAGDKFCDPCTRAIERMILFCTE